MKTPIGNACWSFFVLQVEAIMHSTGVGLLGCCWLSRQIFYKKLSS